MHSTDAVYSCKRSSVVCLYVCLCVSLGLLATTRSRAKTDEPIECRLGGTRPGLGYMGPTNHVLDRGVHIVPREWGTFEGDVCRRSIYTQSDSLWGSTRRCGPLAIITVASGHLLYREVVSWNNTYKVCRLRLTALFAVRDSRGLKELCIRCGTLHNCTLALRCIELCTGGDAGCRYHNRSNLLHPTILLTLPCSGLLWPVTYCSRLTVKACSQQVNWTELQFTNSSVNSRMCRELTEH